MSASNRKTTRLTDRDRIIRRINLALMLFCVWLGTMAASALLLTGLSDRGVDPATATPAAPAPKSTIIADRRYRSWDDVATSPLPPAGEDRSATVDTAPPAAGFGGKQDKGERRQRRNAEQERRQREQVKHDPKSVVDL